MEAYVELGKQITALQKERDAMQAKFLAEMGEAELAIAGDRVVTRSWVKPKDISYTRDGYYSARVRKRRKNEY